MTKMISYLCAKMRMTCSATSAAAALSRVAGLTNWANFPLKTPVVVVVVVVMK